MKILTEEELRERAWWEYTRPRRIGNAWVTVIRPRRDVPPVPPNAWTRLLDLHDGAIVCGYVGEACEVEGSGFLESTLEE